MLEGMGLTLLAQGGEMPYPTEQKSEIQDSKLAAT